MYGAGVESLYKVVQIFRSNCTTASCFCVPASVHSINKRSQKRSLMKIISFGMSFLTILLRYSKLSPFFDDIIVPSAPVSTGIFDLQLFIEIYSHVADMVKICSLV